MAMDHGRDPCPWVILNDFGGAFAMGVRPYHPSPSTMRPTLLTLPPTGNRRHDLARHQRLSQQPLRRAADRRHHSCQDARARIRRQLRRLGWHLQLGRLRRQGRAAKRGPVERHRGGLPDGWRAGDTGRVQVGEERRHRVCCVVGGNRGRRNWVPEDDGGQHKIGGELPFSTLLTGWSSQNHTD